MTRPPPRYELAFLATIGTVGAVLVGVALAITGLTVSVVVHSLAAMLAAIAPARLRQEVSVSLLTVVVFTALVLGGTPLAVTTAIGAALGTALHARTRRAARVVFNLGMFAAAAAVAGGVAAGLGAPAGAPLALASDPAALFALAAASLAYTVVNFLAIAAIVWLTSGESLSDTVATLFGSTAVLQLVYVALSLTAAIMIVEVDPVALSLLLVPLMVARWALLGTQAQDDATRSLVGALVKAIEVKDGYTRGHAERVAGLAESVAAEMGIDYRTRRVAHDAALLHDIGKIGVPTAIITKRGALDDGEFALIKQHPSVGAAMLRDIDVLAPALDVIRHHHERFDGRGYPAGLCGEQIPLLARLTTVVDAFDAMTSTRSYRKALPLEVALEELRRCAGTQFDPACVAALERVVASGSVVTEVADSEPVLSQAGHVRRLAREVAG